MGEFSGVSERGTLVKQAALWFRIHALLDRSLTAAKHMAALITKMENRIPRGPSDFDSDSESARGVWINYGDLPTPPNNRVPTQEPSWQKAISGIVGALIVVGIPAIFTVLWAMNTTQEQMNGRLSKIEEHQAGEHNLTIQRLDAIDKHLEATDKQVGELTREVWPHKH